MSRTIRALRKSRGLSLAILAERSEVSRSMLIQVEQERTSPSLGVLVRIARALDVTLTELVAFDQPASARVLAPDSATVLWRGDRGGLGRLLAGSSGRVRMQVWDWRECSSQCR